MALPTAPFRQVEEVVQRLQDSGLEVRTLKRPVETPYGLVYNAKYIVDPNDTKNFFVLDYQAGEFLAPSAIESIERRFGVDLGFSKGAVFDRGH